jgi:predicted oxidoreductase
MSTVQVPSPAPGVGGETSWYIQVLGGTWSKDNSVEVAKGWILSANDLNTLAAMIAADPQNEGKMTGAQLTATVNAWNTDIANKTDAQFLTNIAASSAINGPPFYAMKIWPQNADPAAGPRRNIECQIVDPYLQPIPRLYSAGEMGAFWGYETSSGSHLAECIWTGRVTGNNAAAESPWTT